MGESALAALLHCLLDLPPDEALARARPRPRSVRTHFTDSVGDLVLIHKLGGDSEQKSDKQNEGGGELHGAGPWERDGSENVLLQGASGIRLGLSVRRRLGRRSPCLLI